MHKSLNDLAFRPDSTLTTELAAIERLKIDATIFSRLLLIRSFLNLQVMRTYMISWMSSNFG